MPKKTTKELDRQPPKKSKRTPKPTAKCKESDSDDEATAALESAKCKIESCTGFAEYKEAFDNIFCPLLVAGATRHGDGQSIA